MGWIKNITKVHCCKFPHKWGHKVGSIWQCDECTTQWILFDNNGYCNKYWRRYRILEPKDFAPPPPRMSGLPPGTVAGVSRAERDG
jgi:hypothetical protein